MGKVTKTFYTGASTAAIAREVAHQAGLDDATTHYDALGARKTAARPHQVRITISVERVPPKPYSDEALDDLGARIKQLGVDSGLRRPAKSKKPK